MRIRSMSPTALIGVLPALAGAALMMACAAPQVGTSPQTSQSNRPPVIQRITGTDALSPTTDGQFQAVASDPDGDELTYTWIADNGTLQGDGDTITWTAPGAMGTYKITVVVKDGKGGEARAVKEAKVLVNADGTVTAEAPIVLKMPFPSKDLVTGTKRLRIWTAAPVECVIEGRDTKDLKFSWTASNGKIQAKGLNEGTASKVTWIAPGVGGDFTLDVIVSDSQGNQARGRVDFTVYCCGNY